MEAKVCAIKALSIQDDDGVLSTFRSYSYEEVLNLQNRDVSLEAVKKMLTKGEQLKRKGNQKLLLSVRKLLRQKKWLRSDRLSVIF